MIRFNRPQTVGRELDYMREAIERGAIGGGGDFAAKCQAWLEKQLGAHKALLTPSCTAALEMAALLLDAKPGDEVIVPSFIFPSAANAFVLRGARPVFADIRPDTLNLDERALEKLITPRTKAIVVMHYGGIACELDIIVDLARKRGVAIIEDNAHGLLGKYKDRHLGSFGAMAAQSFHETKNFTCGEGGALLLNDDKFIARAEIIREKGTDRARFFRGEIDKYSWVDIGSSYLPSELQAAFLFAQFEAREKIQTRRREIWDLYATRLRGWAAKRGAQLPFVPDYAEHPSHLFFLLLKTGEQRNRLIAHLREAGVQSTFHFVPLHLSRMGKSFGGKEGDCPVSESASERLLRLPFHHGLTSSDLEHVVAALEKFPG